MQEATPVLESELNLPASHSVHASTVPEELWYTPFTLAPAASEK